MADKKIKLYKVNSDGTLDKDSQLLPETNAESVIYEKKVETNISLLDVPNWEEFSEISADTWLTIYEDLSGKIIQVGNYDSSYMVEIIDTNTGSGYIISNTTNETFTADIWYEFAGYGSEPVQTTTPDIELDVQNIIEGYEDLFNAITSSETITTIKTVKTQLDAPIKEATYDSTQKLALLDIPNWENIIEAMSSGSSGTIYYYEGADRTIQIGCSKYDDSSSDYDYRYEINITDYDISTSAERRYHIQNVTTPWSRKDVWYETVFDGEYDTDIPVTTPDIPLDPQYAEGTEYGALFDSISGNKQINITLQDKLEEPLKDKTYGKIEVVKEVPNDFVDGNEYEYYDNMNFSSDDYELLTSLSDGMLIYEDEVSGTVNYLITVSINNGTTALEVYDAFRDVTYTYTIYAFESFVNEWDNFGTIPADLTVYTNCIRNSAVLKRMLNVGTHTEVEYKNQTLEEKNADIKNWKYEDGLKDIPDWSKFESLDSYETFYNDSDKIVISASYDGRNDCYSINISDVVNTKYYMIYSENVSFDVLFEKNKWYEGILYDRETIPTQCDTPKINLSKQYIIIDAQYQDLYNNLFDAIYQTITVDDKFNSMDGLLKDKIYDKLAEELVDGQSYGLTDNYDEFFEKYSTAQSQLIYGNPGNSSGSTPIEEPLLVGGSKVGDVPNILTIYLNTDGTPIRGGGNLTKDKILDGEPALGASDIIITTSDNYTFHFYVNTNSWQEYYNGEWQNVPLQYVPRLILDSSLILNEEMLRDFLQLGYKEQTLKEKLDGFKTWTYDDGEPQANVVYTLPSSYDYSKLTDGRVYQAGITPGPTPIDPGGQLVGMSVSNGKSSLPTNEESQEIQQEKQTTNTRKSGTKSVTTTNSNFEDVLDVYSISVDIYSDGSQINIQGTNSIGDTYRFIQYENEPGWYCDDTGDIYDHISIRISGTNGIYDEQSLKEILALKPLTLEEKFDEVENAELKDKIYESVNELVNGKSYTLPTHYDTDTFDISAGEVQVYSDTENNFFIGTWVDNSGEDSLLSVYVDFKLYESDEDVTDFYYDYNTNKWYYDVQGTPTEWTDGISFTYNENYLVNNSYKDLLCKILNIQCYTDTLKQKLDNFKNWTYNTIPASYKMITTPDWDSITKDSNTLYDGNYDDPLEVNYCRVGYMDTAYVIEDYESLGLYMVEFQKLVGYDSTPEPIYESYYNFSDDCVVGNGSSQQLTKGVWYLGDDSDPMVFTEAPNINMLFHDYDISSDYEEEFFEFVEFIPEQKVTLGGKFEDLENQLNELPTTPCKQNTYAKGSPFKTSIDWSTFSGLADEASEVVYGELDETTGMPTVPFIQVTRNDSAFGYQVMYVTELDSNVGIFMYSMTSEQAGGSASGLPNKWYRGYLGEGVGDATENMEKVPDPFIVDTSLVKNATYLNAILNTSVEKDISLEEKFSTIDKIPTPPTDNGNYVLKVGVADNGSTRMFAWVPGGQSYKHNVLLKKEGSRYYDYIFINNIVSNSNSDLTYSDITSYLNGKYDYDSNKVRYRQNIYTEVAGWSYDSNSSTYTWYIGVQRENSTTLHTFTQTGDGSIDISSGWTIEDTVIPL